MVSGRTSAALRELRAPPFLRHRRRAPPSTLVLLALALLLLLCAQPVVPLASSNVPAPKDLTAPPSSLGGHPRSPPSPSSTLRYRDLLSAPQDVSPRPWYTPTVSTGISRTVVLYNGTVIPRDIEPPDNAAPNSASWDPTSSTMWVVGNAPCVLSELSGTPLRVLTSINLSSTTPGCEDLSYDAATNDLFATGGTSGILDVVDATSATLVSTPSVPNSDLVGEVYDPTNALVYVANEQSPGGEVLIFNTTTGSFSTTTYAVGSNPDALALDVPAQQLFVANDGSGDVSVINVTTGVLQATIGVGASPDGIAFDPLAGEVGVANGGSGNVSLIDVKTDKSVGQLATGYEPEGAWSDPTTGDLYVTSLANDNVSVLDPTALTHVATIPVGRLPTDIVESGSSAEVYVVDLLSGGLTEIDTSSNSVVATVLTGANGIIGVYDPTDQEVFITDQVTDRLWALNAYNLSVIGWVPVGGFPQGIAWDPGTDRLFVADQWNTPPDHPLGAVTVVDAATRQVVATISTGDQPVGAIDDPGTGEVYVENSLSGNVTVLDAATLQSVTAIQTGSGSYPFAGTWDPQTHEIWVEDAASSAMSVINTTSNTVVGNVPVGPAPNAAVYDPANGNIYVGSSGSDLVTPVNGTTLAPLPNIEVGQGISGIDVDSANGYLEDSAQGSNTIDVIDPSTASWVATYPDPGSPDDVFFDPLTGYFLQANQGTGTVTAAGLLIVTNFSASPAAASLGAAVTLSASAPDGTASIKWSYSGLPAGCSSSNTSTLRCTPTQEGTFQVTVYANDSLGKTAIGALLLSVSGPLEVSASADPSSLTRGGSTTLTMTSEGGTLPIHYVGLSGLPASVSCGPVLPATTVSVVCKTSEAGNFSATFTVADSGGANETATADFTVNLPVELGYFEASPGVVPLGEGVLLSVAAYRGTTPYSYAYRLPPGCNSQNLPSLTCKPSSSGTFEAEVTVTDDSGSAASAWVNFTVYAPLQVLQFTPSSASFGLGASLSFSTSTAGGLAPFSYSYPILPPGCTGSNSSTLPCTPDRAGTFEAEVRVSDPEGQVAYGFTNITVQSTSTGLEWVEEIGVVGAVVAVLVVVVLVMLRRRKRGRGAPGGEPGAAPAPPSFPTSPTPPHPPSPLAPYPPEGGSAGPPGAPPAYPPSPPGPPQGGGWTRPASPPPGPPF